MTTRYFALQEEIENLPLSSIQIFPTTYKFRFRGEVKVGNGSACVYDVMPRNHRPGLFQGQIWIEASSLLRTLKGASPDAVIYHAIARAAQEGVR